MFIFALVDHLAYLLDLYRLDRRLEQLLTFLGNERPARIQINGLKAAQETFVLAGAYLARPHTLLIVAADKEEAAYWQNDLAGLLNTQKIHFFPDSFKRPAQFDVLNPTSVLERTEVINQISSSKLPEIIVTYPEALFEKVVSPQVLADWRLEIKQGEEMDVDTAISFLLDYGFERADYVIEPGQFSIRGGIIDIFSYGNEWPYRVELFDEEVESIRTFDPMTQLSKQRIGMVSIVPNINTKFQKTDKVSLFQVLPEGVTVWMKDFQILLDRLQTCFEKAEAFAQTISILDEGELAEIFRHRAFVFPRDVVADLQQYPVVLTSSGNGPLQIQKTLSINGQPQPSFNKNFSLLIENLEANTAKGFTNYLFTDNPKQIERLQAIFKDLHAKVQWHPVMHAIHQGFIDPDLKIACYTDHQIFDRFHPYRLRQGFSKDQAVNLRMLRELQPGDFVVHMDHGVGRFSGMEKININGHVQESVRLVYKNNDLLYVSINSLHKLSKFTGKDGTEPALSKLGSDAWNNLKRKTKKQLKDIAAELIKLYAQRKASKGFAFSMDGYLQNELEASFIYEDTPDQLKATNDVKDDMMKAYPMDRLICGDVGFGKTEVAIRGAFKAVTDGKQVAILVPTTILALQHYRTFKERLQELPVSVDYVNRFRSAKEKREIFEKLQQGGIDIVIGTHALLNKEVKVKDLGLLIIDEEQKFGVSSKEKLRNIKVNVDTLTLTATPIPRTLQFSLMAARDLSIIRTPPPNRQPIHTEVRIFSEEVIKDAIYYEINRGGQVFFVHNRVKDLIDIAALVKRICPDVDVATAHGQMDSDKLEHHYY